MPRLGMASWNEILAGEKRRRRERMDADMHWHYVFYTRI